MYAHKIRVVAGPSTDIVVRLPPDFPAGNAEVIILSEAHVQPRTEAREPPSPRRLALLQALAERFPLDPTLGPVLCQEDPTAPLDENDWPAELRP